MKDSIYSVSIYFDEVSDCSGLWKSFSDWSQFVYEAYDTRIFCFVCLRNRLDLIMSMPRSSRGFVLQMLVDILWQESQVYFSHFLELVNLNSLYCNYRRIYNGPKRLKLVSDVQSYPFSTLNCLLGDTSVSAKEVSFFLVCDPIGFQLSDANEVLDWLNEETLEYLKVL